MPGMHMGGLPPFSWHTLFTTWEWRLWWDVFILLAFAAYTYGLMLARRRRTGGLPWYRVTAFMLGLLTLVFSVNTAINTYSHVLFWDHMVQHLLLIMVVPALLVLGSPLTLLVQVTTGRAHRRVTDALSSNVVAVLTHPLFGLLLYSVVIVATHLTSFMEQMMIHPWLHGFEQVLYVVTGYVFLLPLLGNEPIRWQPPFLLRLLVLFIAMAPDTVVGIVLLQADHELFPSYASIHRMWGPSPLADLNRGGGIMWVYGDGLMMLFIVGVIIAYLAHASSNPTAGNWIEGVRRGVLADNLEAVGESADLTDSDLDEDDAALVAYNRMLARMNEEPPPRS